MEIRIKFGNSVVQQSKSGGSFLCMFITLILLTLLFPFASLHVRYLNEPSDLLLRGHKYAVI